ncbi:MAG: hypothetical protein EP347_00550 [Alphaproteobacteria bacterium]|nr:MAG: hypothetical protein EP347_00550 [Alphaproteobacteria bacterium]
MSKAFRNLAVFSLVVSALLAGISSAQAGEPIFLSSDKIEYTADNSGDIVAFGGDIEISGVGKGDVIALGDRVEIDMINKGDVVALGSKVAIAGVVKHDVVGVGENVFLSMTAANDLAAIGAQVLVDPDASVGGEASLFGDDVIADGTYAGEVEAHGSNIILSGQFANNVVASGDQVTLEGYFSDDVTIRAELVVFGESVQFLGDLTIMSPNPVEVPVGIVVGGRTQIVEITSQEVHEEFNFPQAMSIFFPLIGLGVALLAGIAIVVFGGGALIIALTGKVSRRGVLMLRDHPGKSFLYGLAVFTAGLIAVVLSAVIYSPLGILGAAFGIAIMLGLSFAAYAVFTLMVDRGAKPHGGGKRFGFALLATILLFMISIFIPILGQLIAVAAMFFGLGAYFGGMVTSSDEIAG